MMKRGFYHAQPRTASRGAAVVTALLIVTIATMAVSGLIWRLFALSQQNIVASTLFSAQEAAIASIDWARVVLSRDSNTYDWIKESWAQTLEPTRIGENLDTSVRANNNGEFATIRGFIVDAQSRLNLRGLQKLPPQLEAEQASFLRLCAVVGIGSGEANQILSLIMQASQPNPGTSSGANAGGGFAISSQSLQTIGQSRNIQPPSSRPIRRWEDLRGAPGLSNATWARLAPFVVFIDTDTRVNINTASAEVIHAAIPDMELGLAQRIVAARDRTPFQSLTEVKRLYDGTNGPSSLTERFSVNTQYFIANGMAQVRSARVIVQAMLHRENVNQVYVLWRTES